MELKDAAMQMGRISITSRQLSLGASQRKMDRSEAPVRFRRRPERGYVEQHVEHVRSEKTPKGCVGEGCRSEKLRKS